MRTAEIWILVADAARAQVLRIPRRPLDLQCEPLQVVFEHSVDHLPLREIMADAPGRSFASVGDRRSAMEYRSDPVREETANFAASLLSELATRHAEGEFDELVICAPPRMLGALRDAMPARLAAIVTSEIGKDLTRLPTRELREVLEDCGTRTA